MYFIQLLYIIQSNTNTVKYCANLQYKKAAIFIYCMLMDLELEIVIGAFQRLMDFRNIHLQYMYNIRLHCVYDIHLHYTYGVHLHSVKLEC